ncbi:MAG: glycosyltransferase [Bacteroidales bacterium]|nr:glycosyltransferase [Bacteroidales bacterium]
MKILQLGKFYPIRGGVEKVMYTFLEGLSARGIECDMLCAECEGLGRTVEVAECARVLTCRTLVKAAGTTIAPSMISTLRRIAPDYDIIHVHHPDPMAALALFLSGYKGKVVLHWHSDIIRQRFFLIFYKWLQNWLIRRADLVIGTTPPYIEKSKGLNSLKHKPLTAVIPIGIEPLARDMEGEAKVRAKWPGKKIVFALGRLIPYKGFEYLIDAAAFLPDDYVVVIGGRGPLKESLLARIQIAGVKNKVYLVEDIPDSEKAAYFGACDVYCMSSITKNEAFGIVMIEAMSLGKPVIATRIPESGVSWVNADGVSGINVGPRDAAAIANAVTDICRSEESYAKYSQGSAARFEDLFTRERMTAKLVEIYGSILK